MGACCYRLIYRPRFWENATLRFCVGLGELVSGWILLYVAFCTIIAISRQKEARSRTLPYSYRMTSRVLYRAQYHKQHCTLQAFEQFGTLYMHHLVDKQPTQSGFVPSTYKFRATTGPIVWAWSSELNHPNAVLMLAHRRTTLNHRLVSWGMPWSQHWYGYSDLYTFSHTNL